MKHWECKYCDGRTPANYGEDRVCSSCGAEWEDAKVLVETSQQELRELEELERELQRYERERENDDYVNAVLDEYGDEDYDDDYSDNF